MYINNSAAMMRQRKRTLKRRRLIAYLAATGVIAGALLHHSYSLKNDIEALQCELSNAYTMHQALSYEIVRLKSTLSVYQEDSADVYAVPKTYSSLPLSEDLQQFTYDMCVVYDVPQHYELMLAMMWQESHFVDNIISSTNDYGIMQINKLNHEWLAEKLGTTDIMDVRQNIEAGVFIMANKLHKYGDTTKALMAYNMGDNGAANAWRCGKTTSAYATSIISKIENVRADNYSAK